MQHELFLVARHATVMTKLDLALPEPLLKSGNLLVRDSQGIAQGIFFGSEGRRDLTLAS
ncbi:hypothetical protein D9M69_580490 [compost metagenome]